MRFCQYNLEREQQWIPITTSDGGLSSAAKARKRSSTLSRPKRSRCFGTAGKTRIRNREEVNEAVRDWRETVMLRAKLDENIVSDLMALPYREAFEAAKDLDYRTPIGEREEGAYANWIADNHPEALA